MRDILHRVVNERAVGDRALDHFEPRLHGQQSAMAERTQRDIGEARVGEKAVNKVATDFARGAGDEEAA